MPTTMKPDMMCHSDLWLNNACLDEACHNKDVSPALDDGLFLAADAVAGTMARIYRQKSCCCYCFCSCWRVSIVVLLVQG